MIRGPSEVFPRYISVTLVGILVAVLILALPGRAPGETPKTLEAEKMRAASGKVFKAEYASGGKGVRLTRPSHASGKLTTPKAERIVVRARARLCKGAPTMTVEVDGRKVMVKKVSSATWREYGAELKAPAGKRAVKISFSGRFETSKCRRNLQLDKISFVPIPPTEQPTEPPPTEPPPTEPPPTEPPPTEPPPAQDLKPECKVSLQDLVRDARPGSVVETPDGCIFREKVTINKPITLKAGTGTEIRGSEVWDEWEKVDGLWRSAESYPQLTVQDRWRCKPGTDRCRRPEQVFVNDGELALAAGAPKPGEFALDDRRRILLAEDPGDERVEVTVRDRWIAGAAHDVTIDGFTMRHSANEGIKNDQYDRWIVKNCDLGYAHSVNLALSMGPGMVARDNHLHHAGQMGFTSNEGEIELIGNEISYNNTKNFDPGWEAGAMKISQTFDARIEDNHVHHNPDFGIWTDVIQEGRQRVEIVGNRVHHHRHQGIRVEITKNVLIEDNVVYENGVDYPGDPNSGAGIGISGSFDVMTKDNTLSNNRNGIVVVNVDRAPYDHVENVWLEGNTVIQNSGKAISWYRAIPHGNIYEESANNGSSNNRFWYPGGENSEGRAIRFKWSSEYTRLSAYMSGVSDSGSRYISDSEKEAVVKRAI